MSKHGVSKISGNPSPKVGEKTIYTITEWYPATPKEKRNPALVTWELFKKRSNGKFTTTDIKKKGDGSFTFGEISQKHIYLLEAYLHHPEGKTPMALEITPQPNEIPKIGKVDLHYADDNKGSIFSFMEKLVAKAHCVNMRGKKLNFMLWEDDAKGEGHFANNLLIDSQQAYVERNGLATVEFMLTKAFMKKAMQGETDPKEFEFYVTVEYYLDKKHSSENVKVNNPLSFEFPPKPKPVPPEKPATAKGSPAEQKPPSKKEEKGIIDKAIDTWNELWDWAESKGTVKKDKAPTQPKSEGRSVSVVKDVQLQVKNCGEKYCIKKGDRSELIREINIRLAGFGGNVPTDEFTDRTEKMIKQFQRDYMKVIETGKICGNVLRAIDEFGSIYTVNINEGKCPCTECSGFGNGLFSEQRNNTKILEKNRKYEYPGIHRSLLWVEKAVKFYLTNHEKQSGLKIGKIFSGYRCNANNRKNRRTSTNHMGKALDLHIYKLTDTNNTERNADKVRDLLIKFTNAEYRWDGSDFFALEPSSRNRVGDEFIATTWVHYDVRTFNLQYLKDEYFVKDNSGVDGEDIMALADRLGFQNTCACKNGVDQSIKSKDEKTNKYKWSHSEFGNLIAKFESSDDYNKCNRTEKVSYKVNGKTKYKRIVKVVNDLKVIDLTIKEIQNKQINKELFAIGRYQLIPNTLNSAISSLGLDTSKKLDQEMQDKIFDDYLIKVKRPKIVEYLEKEGIVEDAMYSSAQEWASIGVEKGKRISDKKTKKDGKDIILKRYAEGGESYYAGDGLNNAHITPQQIRNALINSKNANK